MSPLAGPLFAAALLVVVAGAAKLRSPGSARIAMRTVGLPSSAPVVRALGAVEVAAGVGAIVVGGRLAAGFVLLAYVAFAAFAARLAAASRRSVPCGCFGSSDAPVSGLHVGIDLALAVVGAASLVRPTDGLAAVLADTPLAGIPFAAFTLILTWLLVVSLTVLPELLATARRPPARTPGTAA